MRAYIAALSGWKRDLTRRVDALITANVPHARKAVKWNSPFYGVEGTTSIIEFRTDVLGNLTLIENDPGPHTTAYGLLADFINAVK